MNEIQAISILSDENTRLRDALRDLLDLVATTEEASKWDSLSTPEAVVSAELLLST